MGFDSPMRVGLFSDIEGFSEKGGYFQDLGNNLLGQLQETLGKGEDKSAGEAVRGGSEGNLRASLGLQTSTIDVMA